MPEWQQHRGEARVLPSVLGGAAESWSVGRLPESGPQSRGAALPHLGRSLPSVSALLRPEKIWVAGGGRIEPVWVGTERSLVVYVDRRNEQWSAW